MRNGKKEVKIPNSTFRIPNWVTPDGPASFCGNPIGSLAGIFLPPMLFPRNTLPFGPQACFSAEKNRSETKGGKGEFIIDENIKN